MTFAIPLALIAAIGLGTLWGLHLRTRRPHVYEAIGLGARSAILTADPATTLDTTLDTVQEIQL